MVSQLRATAFSSLVRMLQRRREKWHCLPIWTWQTFKYILSALLCIGPFTLRIFNTIYDYSEYGGAWCTFPSISAFLGGLGPIKISSSVATLKLSCWAMLANQKLRILAGQSEAQLLGINGTTVTGFCTKPPIMPYFFWVIIYSIR